jgi:8-oxo-dGTP diphosphatase
MIRVTAALIYNNAGAFLIAERAHGKLAGKWEFPGGKIEEGETEQDAVKREIREELGVDVIPEKIVGIFKRTEPDKEIELILVECTLSSDQKIISDGSHLAHAWVQFSECENFDFAPIDVEMVEYLQQQKNP